jgi:chromosome segregation ATPase
VSATKTPKGHAFELIPLTVETRGEVIASNVDEFREMVTAALATINRDPATDEEFGQAEIDVKGLKTAEQAVAEAKSKALEDAAEIRRLFDALDDTILEIREARLELERQIKAKKAEVRERIIDETLADLGDTLQMKPGGFRGEIESAIKGKRTLESMIDETRGAAAIIVRRVNECRDLIEAFEHTNGRELTMDRDALELKIPDNLAAELRRRLELAQAEAEKRKLREQAEKAKAEAEALKAKAAEAKSEVTEVTEVTEAAKPELPKPPKVEALPTGPSAAGEWAGFETAVIAAFGPLKEAKGRLKHPVNVARAKRFAVAVNAAWKQASGKPAAPRRPLGTHEEESE